MVGASRAQTHRACSVLIHTPPLLLPATAPPSDHPTPALLCSPSLAYKSAAPLAPLADRDNVHGVRRQINQVGYPRHQLLQIVLSECAFEDTLLNSVAPHGEQSSEPSANVVVGDIVCDQMAHVRTSTTSVDSRILRFAQCAQPIEPAGISLCGN